MASYSDHTDALPQAASFSPDAGAASGSAPGNRTTGAGRSPAASLCSRCYTRPPLLGAEFCQSCVDELAPEPTVAEKLTSIYERGAA